MSSCVHVVAIAQLVCRGRAAVVCSSSCASRQACVTGMFELRDFSAFKQHARDFLVQTKSFADKDNAELFAEEAAATREVRGPAHVPDQAGEVCMHDCQARRGCSEPLLGCIPSAALRLQAERERLAAIPGMVHPHEQAEETMGD